MNYKGYILCFALVLALVGLVSASVSMAQTDSQHGDLPLMKVEEVTDLIMSPGCDYLYTLTLCPSEEAKQMRKIVKDKLLAGETKDEIIGYFAQVYGPRALAQPAKKGFYYVAWWFPYFLLADLFVIVGVVLFIWRKRTRNLEGGRKEAETEGSAADEQAIDDIIEEEVKKFRDE